MTTSVQAGGRPETSDRPNFRHDIQGLRAVAVLLVVIYHAGANWLGGGYVGVDVFFVISGFLITTHLLQSLELNGRIPFALFYAKRARRILPAALVVASLTVVAAWIWMPPLLMHEVLQGAVATAVYLPNMLFAIQGTNYLSESAPSVFQHYWSLGIEEQFYLFLPVVLAVGFWMFKRKEKALLWTVAVLTAGSFTVCIIALGVSPSWAFFSLPTRAWELGAGCLVAFLMRSGAAWLTRPLTGVLAWAGLAMLIVVGFLYDSGTPFPGSYALVPVLATALIIVGGGAPSRFDVGRLLGRPVFQRIGAISYSLYLVHWPLQVIPQAVFGLNNPLPYWLRLLLGLAAFPLAWALYRFVERPAKDWPTLKLGRPLLTGVVAATASVVVVALAVGTYAVSAQTALVAEHAVVQAPRTTAPVGTSFVPTNLTPSLRASSGDNPTIYNNDCHRDFRSTDSTGCQSGSNLDAPLVFLFGDSHAASWFPALNQLATDGKIRLDTNTKSSCHSVDAPKLRNGTAYTQCPVWRNGVIERINSEQPDLVLIANYGVSNLAGGNEGFADRWKTGLEKTIRSMPGVPTAVISDVPGQGTTPAICLSANLDRAAACSTSRGDSLNITVTHAERDATAAAGAAYLDMTPYFCNEQTCPPIIGHTLVYRDAHHLTATFSRSLAPKLGRLIDEEIGE